MHRGPDAAQPSPLGLPMTDELLADSFLKRLFARFYDSLHTAGGRVPSNLQVRPQVCQTQSAKKSSLVRDVHQKGATAPKETDQPPLIIRVAALLQSVTQEQSVAGSHGRARMVYFSSTGDLYRVVILTSREMPGICRCPPHLQTFENAVMECLCRLCECLAFQAIC